MLVSLGLAAAFLFNGTHIPQPSIITLTTISTFGLLQVADQIATLSGDPCMDSICQICHFAS